MTDRVMERMNATQPGHVPASERPAKTVTHIADYKVGVTPCSAKWKKVDRAPFRDDDGDLIQQWYWVETL